MPIISIGNAIAIAIPAPARYMPAAVALLPVIGLITITNAFTQPVALDPMVAMSAPIPISRNPNITVAMGRKNFVA